MTGCNILPQDLIIHILSWLPVISLLRFKSVCKSWFALIENSTFISQHLHHTSLKDNSNTHLLHICHLSGSSKDSFLLLSDKTCDVSLNAYFDKQDYRGGLQMIGSCNGIVFLCAEYNYNQGDLYLWNPVTREIRPVPESSISVLSLGFEYDAKTNDYKVIKFGLEEKGNEIDEKINEQPLQAELGNAIHEKINDQSLQAEVYSLRTDSWRSIDTIVPVDSIAKFPRVHLNGIYYWLAEPDTLDQALLSFDVRSEVFRITPLPNVLDPDDYEWSLGVLNESVVLFNPDRDGICLKIWILNQHGATNESSKIYKIEPFSGYTRPLGFSRNGELFMRCDYQLELFNPLTQEIRSLQVVGDAILLVLSYTESLVSLRKDTLQLKG